MTGKPVTSRELAGWLMQHRDNDIQLMIHGQGVPIGKTRYNARADAIELHPLDCNDLHIATAFCPEIPKPHTFIPLSYPDDDGSKVTTDWCAFRFDGFICGQLADAPMHAPASGDA